MARHTTAKDNLFQTPLAERKSFVFDEAVAAVFNDMISRSVPFYQLVQMETAALANHFYQHGTYIYDLGCSTGTTLVRLAEHIPAAHLVGVDSSSAMLEQCRKYLSQANLSQRVVLRKQEFHSAPFDQASVVVMNYSLQFIPPPERRQLIRRIFQDLVNGGALILTEKVVTDDATFQSILTELHFNFKRRQGYSDLEIAQKRDALENVLVPWSINENLELLQQSGFQPAGVVLQCYNFATFLAIK